MRCYVGVTPKEIKDFFESNSFSLNDYLSVSRELKDENLEIDDEEREFELSLKAADISREKQGGLTSKGFLIVMEVNSTKPITWLNVEAILVAETDEPELSWYAPQEVETFLLDWLA